jgi:hypothetical protein
MDEEGSRFDYLVLNFHHVSQLDTSAIVMFSKLAQLSERVGFHVIISSADDNSIKQLVKHRFFTFADLTWEGHYKEQLDVAVDWCERRILNDLKLNAEDQNLSLPDITRRIAYDESDVLLLAKFFKVENKKAGEYLFQEGDDGESPYFVGSGTVIVVMKIPRQQEKILRK